MDIERLTRLFCCRLVGFYCYVHVESMFRKGLILPCFASPFGTITESIGTNYETSVENGMDWLSWESPFFFNGNFTFQLVIDN